MTQEHKIIIQILKDTIAEMHDTAKAILENKRNSSIAVHKIRLEILTKKLNTYLAEYQQEIA